MDRDCIYYQRIASRSFIRFAIGLYPRIMQYIKFWIYRRNAIKQGAVIGEDSIIIKELSKRANHNLTIGSNSSIGSFWKCCCKGCIGDGCNGWKSG